MTKGAPKTGDETKQVIEEQLKATKLDHFDLYAWHGINTKERLQQAAAPGGPLDVLKRLQEQGVIGKIGFSTHGDYPAILSAISSDLFDFVNLHYYYFFQRNWGAIQLARAHDMGVFIISPNDKGGQLFNSPPLLKELCQPLTPITFNARFCLRTPLVQTVCFGVHQKEHFEELRGVLPVSVPMTLGEQEILARLDARLSVDPLSAYDGYELLGDPSGINVPEVLRFRRMLKCYDMLDFGRYRYNMFTPGSDWFGGEYATPENIAKLDLSRVPDEIPVKEMLAETHAALYVHKNKS
jgi:predicted aldo/keto reductase-like oxidoreductase